MGHAGAIISGGKGTAAEKISVMKAAGILVAESPADIGITAKNALDKLKKKVPAAKKARRKIKGKKKTSALLKKAKAKKARAKRASARKKKR